MTPGSELQKDLRLYLLGQLDDRTAEALEKQFLLQDEIFEELLAAEEELIEDYLAEALTAEDRRALENHFLSTPERLDQLKFGRTFRRYLSGKDQVLAQEVSSSVDLAPADGQPAVPPKTRSVTWWTSVRAFFAQPGRAVAFTAVVLAVGLGIWYLLVRQSPVDEGLLALNSAYREQRPLESRISNFNYAPYVVTRGPGDERIDRNKLSRAELTLLNELETHPNPAVHHALGKVYLAKKDFDKAIEEFNESLKGDPNNAQTYSDLGAAWLEKGKIDRDGKEPGKGLEELGRSLENLNKALGLNSKLLEALFNRALCRQWLRHYQQAEDDWREYLNRDPNSPWANEATQRLREIQGQHEKTSQSKQQLLQDFITAYQAGDDELAWAAISRSRERKGNLIVEELIDEYLSFATTARQEEATVKLRMLRYEAQIEKEKSSDKFTSDLVAFYENATPAQRELSLQARQVAKSANTLYYKVEFEQALTLYSKALQLFNQATNDCEAFFVESWMGYCYLRIPKAKESIKTFERVAKIYEQRSYRSLYAQSLYALSDATLTINEFSKALDYTSRSLKLSEEIADRVNIVRSYGQILSLQLNLGSYREALTSMSAGLESAQSSVYDPTLIWHLYHEAALAYHSQGLNAAAFDCETEAERLADISHNPLLKARSLDRLALLYEQTHDYEKAVELLNQALNEAETISGESSKAVTQVHTTLALGQLHREMGNFPQAIANYDRTLDLSTKLDNLEIYLYQARKGRLLAFISLHDDGAAERELDAVVSLFENYRQKIVEETYRNRFFDAGQNTYDIAVDFEYSRQRNFEKAFKLSEAYRSRSLFELMTNSQAMLGELNGLENERSMKPLDGVGVANKMPDGVQILEYSVLDDKVVMWVVTRNGLQHAETNIKASDLDRKVAEYRDALIPTRADDSGQLNALAKELYADLIAPVEDRGYLNRDRQLCIVPDKALNFLPFAALVSPSSGQYLVQNYTLQIAPSATVFIKSSENAGVRADKHIESLLAVGNPSFDETHFVDLPNLPSAEREAQEVASFYNPATLLVENEATVARVRQALPSANIIHFATHAVLDDRSPLQSKLLLTRGSLSDTETHHATDDYLEASEIYSMKLPATRLVVLSACRTGIERSYRGEGAIGLARPFMAAGVPLVVASLWAVDSAATEKLMVTFHKYRTHDGAPTVEAFRHAQLEMIKSSDKTLREPYVWAAFVPIGGYAKF